MARLPPILNHGTPAEGVTPRAFSDAFAEFKAHLHDGDVPQGFLRAASGLRAMEPALIAAEPARRAFFTNLYNAMVIHGAKALGLRRTVWEHPAFFRRVRYDVAGRVLSLHEIEHGILRGNRAPPYGWRRPFSAGDPRRALSLPLDPRLHFTLNCGAASCPPVRVYEAEKMEEQLERATRGFIASDVALDEGAKVARLPRFFKWFRRDFGDARAFVGRYAGRDLSGWRLEFKPYDWSLFLKVEE